MLSMVLVGHLVVILEWEEDGVVLMDGPTDTDPIGDGGVICGEVLAQALGALIIKNQSFPGLKNKVKALNIEC